MPTDALPDLHARRILLVVQEPSLADTISYLLRDAGFLVETAYNVGDALAAQHDRFSAAVLDSNMRDREGRSLFDLVSAHPTFSALPLILLNDFPATSAPEGGARVDGLALLRRVGETIWQREAAAAKGARTPQPDDTLILPALSDAAIRSDETPLHTARRAFDAHLQQQLAALKTLSALGRSISSVLDLNAVLNQIVQAATTLTGAEEGLLLLPDEEDSALYLRAMKGIDDDSAQNFRIRSADTLIGNVYRTGEPVLVGDQGLLRVKTQYFVRSLVYVPMTYQGRVIGVLGVNNRHSGRLFTATDQELLLDLAAHAAIAIENARLYEERVQQNRQLTTLVEAGMAVNSTLALGDVLLALCRQVIKAFDVEGCLVQQLDAGGEHLRPLAWVSHAAWRSSNAPRLGLDSRPMLLRAIRENAFYVVTREQKDERWREELARLDRLGMQGMVVLPLRPGPQPALGALEIFYRGDMPEIGAEFRSQMRAQALEIAARLAEKRGAQPGQETMAAVRHLASAAGANWFVIWTLPDAENEPGQIMRAAEYGAAVYLDAPFPGPQLIIPEIRPVLERRSVLNHHVRESGLPETIYAQMAALGALSLLCLPLRIKDTIFGMFTIYGTLEARRFRPDEISLASALITQAGTTIENARLYHDLQRSLEDLKQAQASLVQAARLSTMGQLAAVVAHQINNPLTTVMVDSEIILQDLTEDSPIRDGVLAIRRAGERAHAVVKRLLSTARSNRSDDDRQWVEVNQTIRNTLDLVNTHIERSRIRLEAHLDDSAPARVLISPGLLEDVWLNLLLNGRDALLNVPHARLVIRSQCGGDHLTVTVQDNGPGILPENLTQIFEPFFTTKPPGEGTGLGLHVCKQVIEQCGGTISVESMVGQGTTFSITLPVRAG